MDVILVGLILAAAAASGQEDCAARREELVFSYAYSALAAGDPGRCAPASAFPTTDEVDSVAGDVLCRRIYFELSVPQALLSRSPAAAGLCVEKMALDEPQTSPADRERFCAALSRDFDRPEKLCAELSASYGPDSCLQVIGEMHGLEAACRALKGESRRSLRCVALQRYARAREAGPSACGDSEFCRALLGEAAALAGTRRAKAARLSCARPEPPAAKPGKAEAEGLRAILELFDRVDAAESPLQPLFAADQAKARLGRRLFFDASLSRGGRMSCASCHDPGHAWSEARARSLGGRGQELKRNAPSLLNIRYYRAFGWDGRRGRLSDQVLAPVEDPAEMGETRPSVLEKLRRAYAREFRAAFGTAEITWERLGESLEEFVRWLGERQGLSPFERLRRDPGALDEQARRGLALFAGKARCVLCHKGSSLSSNTFYNVGLSPAAGSEDEGRRAVTGLGPKRAFRTPSLWNVARTPPYGHDGRLATLEDVVAFYDRGGDDAGEQSSLIQPLSLSAAEKRDLVAFLDALTRPAEEGLP